MIDYWTLTKDFKPGDFVQKFMPGRSHISPYQGRVTAVMPGIGFVDVQWPFGTERVSPEELVKVNPGFALYLPPALSFSDYSGYDAKRASVKASWRASEVPPDFYRELARVFHKGVTEVHAYDEMWHRFASVASDSVIRGETVKFYRFASKTVDVLLSQYAQKTATYWYSQNRQHRATRAEVEANRPNCPKCGTSMHKTTYKMSEGQRVKLFACPKDLYLMRQSDILGPEGAPVNW